MNYAQTITESIGVREAFARYGFDVDRKGNICCPFHNEKNPSLGTYAGGKRWKCFGCGEGGSVIDFVMKLFGLEFTQAIAKINYDFSLSLPIGQKLSVREQRELKKRETERKRLAEIQQEEKARNEAEYQSVMDMWVISDETIRLFNRFSKCAFDYPPEYWKAILYRKTADYLLDCMER